MGLLDVFRRSSPASQMGDCARRFLARRCPTAKVEQAGTVFRVTWEAGGARVTWDVTELVPLVGHYPRWPTEVEEHFERFLRSPAAGPHAPPPAGLPPSPPPATDEERIAVARRRLEPLAPQLDLQAITRSALAEVLHEVGHVAPIDELPGFSPTQTTMAEREKALGRRSNVEALLEATERDPSETNLRVLSDALMERGDPHGELIRLELDGGVPERIEQLRVVVAGSSHGAIARWERGFAAATTALTPPAAARELFARPVGRLLRRVHLSSNENPLMVPSRIDPAVRGTLLSLPLNCEEVDVEGVGARSEMNALMPLPVGPILTLCPKLKVLNLGSLPLSLSPGQGPLLEFFQGTVRAAGDVFELDLPRIEAFTLYAATPTIPPPSAWRARFPSLTHLRLGGPANAALVHQAAGFAAQGIVVT
ncbi:MAG: hypothetical protein Q8S33_13430 [Myxococcales bacterium]|nr:hypothetical protein [Myxococcales bacterium]